MTSSRATDPQFPHRAPAAPSDGYLAPPEPPLEARLPAGSRWREVEHRPVVTSTNTLLAQRARWGAAPGLVMVAERQTAGRGRQGRRWEDRPGGSVAVSALVDDVFPRPTLVPLATGLAVREVVRAAGVPAMLKWPNDVLVERRKCAGILVERVAEAGRIVIGVGLNIDWRGTDRSGDTASWTSLAEVLDRDVDPWEVVTELLGALDRWVTVAERDPGRLVADYRGACDTLGREVRVELRDGVVAGVAEDVAEDGALLLRAGERRLRFDAGDVEHLRPAD